MDSLLKRYINNNQIDLDILINVIMNKNKAKLYKKYYTNPNNDIKEVSRFILNNNLKIVNKRNMPELYLKCNKAKNSYNVKFSYYNDDEIDSCGNLYVYCETCLQLVIQLLIDIIINDSYNNFDIIELIKLLNLQICCLINKIYVHIILLLTFNIIKPNITEEFLYEIMVASKYIISNDFGDYTHLLSGYIKSLKYLKCMTLNNKKVNSKHKIEDNYKIYDKMDIFNDIYDEKYNDEKYNRENNNLIYDKSRYKNINFYKLNIPLDLINFQVKDDNKMILYCIYTNNYDVFNKLKDTIKINSDDIIYQILNSHLLIFKYSIKIIKYIMYTFKYQLDLSKINIINTPKHNFNNLNIPCLDNLTDGWNIDEWDINDYKYITNSHIYAIYININSLLKNYKLSFENIINLYKNRIIFDYSHINLSETQLEKIYFEYFMNVIEHEKYDNCFANYRLFFIKINKNNKNIIFREKFGRLAHDLKSYIFTDKYNIDRYCIIYDYIEKKYKLREYYNNIWVFNAEICEFNGIILGKSKNSIVKYLKNQYKKSPNKLFEYLTQNINDNIDENSIENTNISNNVNDDKNSDKIL